MITFLLDVVMIEFIVSKLNNDHKTMLDEKVKSFSSYYNFAAHLLEYFLCLYDYILL